MATKPKPQKSSLALRDGMSHYLQQISKIPILSKEEESRLAKVWYETRDREAGQKLVVSNLRFVIKIAKEYSHYGFKLPELIQEGNLGLLHALDKFEPQRGYRLITYAVWWIRAYIQSYILRSWSMVRTGTTRVQRKLFSSLQKARQKISALTPGSAPDRKELAQALDVSQSDFDEALHRMEARDVSLDQPLSRDAERSFGETLPDESVGTEERLIAEDLRSKVRQKLDAIYDDLAPRERYLLEHRILSDDPITLEAAGKEFGVTRERVRQLEERLKGKLQVVFQKEYAAVSKPAATIN